MSRLVDERVVEMSFDNSNFEKNVKTSISTIDELKESLDFSEVTTSIDKSLGSVDTSILANGLTAVSNKFSSLEIAGITAISNITNKVIDLGLQMVKSLSVDNIASGWQKYADKTTSVATLISQGYDIDTVNNELEKLNFFTDETSYTFTDMVSNISKFTAAGQDLTTSVEAMMGIANWAALSGQNASTASRAMYQLSQAMSAGVVKLMDWRSIQTANMDTQEFRQSVLDAAVAAGKLEKTITGEYNTLTGKTFNIDSFTEQLSEGWFTSDILISTLKRYSSAVDQIYNAVEEGAYSTASEAIEGLSDELDVFGLKAFRAAQEAKTFEDTIGSVKEAVASGWMATFENIFGSYDEAKTFWTDLANELYDVFAEGGNTRNEWLAQWVELGGRDDLFVNTDEQIGAFWNLYYALVDIVNIIKTAISEVFPYFSEELDENGNIIESNGQRLKNFTARLKEFSEKLKLSDDASLKFKNIIKGILSIFKLIGKVFNGITIAVKPLINLFKQLFGTTGDALGNIGEKFSNFVDSTTFFERAGIKIAYVIQTIIDSVSSFINKISLFFKTNTKFQNGFSSLKEFLENIINNIKTFFNSFKNLNGEGFDSFINILSERFKPLSGIFKGIGDIMVGLMSVVKAMLPIIGQLFSGLGKLLSYIGKILEKLFGGGNPLLTLKDILTGGALASILFIFYEILKTSQWAADIVGSISDVIYSKALEQYANALKTFAISVLILVGALVILSKIDSDKLTEATSTLIIVMGALMGMLLLMKKIFGGDEFGSGLTGILKAGKSSAAIASAASALIKMVLAILILVAAIKILSEINEDAMINSLLTLTALMATMVIMAKTISSIDNMSKGALGLVLYSIAISILANAIYKISQIDFAAIMKTLAVMAIALGSIYAISKVFSNQTRLLASISAFSLSLSMLGISLSIFGSSLKVFNNLKYDSFAKLLIALSSVTAFVIGLAALDKLGFTRNIAKALLILAGLSLVLSILGISFLKLALGLKAIEKVEWSALGKAVTIIAVMMAFMIALSALMSTKIGLMILGACAAIILFAIGLDMLAISLTAMALALKACGLTNKSDLGKLMGALWSLIGIGLALAVAGVFAPLVMLFAAGLASLGKALIVLAAGLVAFKLVSKSDLGLMIGTVMALIGIGLALAIAGVFAPLIILFAAGLAALGASFIPLAAGLKALSYVSWKGIGKGMVVLAGSMAVLIVSAYLLKPISGVLLKVAISCLIFAVAATLLITVLTILGGILSSLGVTIGDMFLKIAEIISTVGPKLVESIFTLIASIVNSLKNILPTIMALVSDILEWVLNLLIEKGPLIIEAVMVILTNLLTKLADNFPTIVESILSMIVTLLTKIKDTIGKIIEIVLELVFKVIDILTDKLPDIIPKLLNFVLEIIEHIIQGIVDSIPRIVGAAFDLVLGLIEGLGQAIEDNAEKVRETMISFCEHLWNAFLKFFGIDTGSSKVTTKAGKSIIRGIFDGISSGISNVIEKIRTLCEKILNSLEGSFSKFYSAGSKVITNIANGIKSAFNTVTNAIKDLIQKIKDAFANIYESMKNIGANIIKGIKDGIVNTWNTVKDAVTSTGDKIKNWFCDTFGIHSPSKVFGEYGEYMLEGLSEGLEENSALNSIKNAIKLISNLIENGMDDQMTIKPILDLSEIQNGTNKIYGMMNDLDGYSITGSNDIAQRTSDSMKKTPNDSQINNESAKLNDLQKISDSSIINNTFNISGNNPQEIADEISRIMQKQVERRHAKWAT